MNQRQRKELECRQTVLNLVKTREQLLDEYVEKVASSKWSKEYSWDRCNEINRQVALLQELLTMPELHVEID